MKAIFSFGEIKPSGYFYVIDTHWNGFNVLLVNTKQY